MTNPTGDTPPRCCGQQPASTKDGPIALVCILCSHAGETYWRVEAADRLAASEQHHAQTGSWLPEVPKRILRSDGREVH